MFFARHKVTIFIKSRCFRFGMWNSSSNKARWTAATSMTLLHKHWAMLLGSCLLQRSWWLIPSILISDFLSFGISHSTSGIKAYLSKCKAKNKIQQMCMKYKWLCQFIIEKTDVWEIKADTGLYNCFLARRDPVSSFMYFRVEKEIEFIFMHCPLFS